MSDTASDAAGELAQRRREQHDGHEPPHGRHEQLTAIAEAIMLSFVALLAAWSGYCAASWDTRSSDLLATSMEQRIAAEGAAEEGLQIRTLDSVAFESAFAAFIAGDKPALKLAVHRMRPAYRRAFDAWLALRPLTNDSAPTDPSLMPQYRVPEQAEARRLKAEAHTSLVAATKAGTHSDGYVRLTVILATVLFLLGISGHFPVRSARYALMGVGGVLIVYSLVQLATLPGPPG